MTEPLVAYVRDEGETLCSTDLAVGALDNVPVRRAVAGTEARYLDPFLP